MKRQTQITREMTIEDLIELYPYTNHYLSKKGIRCVMCGEPVWLTLEEAAREKGFSAHDIDVFINELRVLALSDGSVHL